MISTCRCGRARVGPWDRKQCPRCWTVLNKGGVLSNGGVLVPAEGLILPAPKRIIAATTMPQQQRRGFQGGKQQRDGVKLVRCKDCKGRVMLKVPRNHKAPYDRLAT